MTRSSRAVVLELSLLVVSCIAVHAKLLLQVQQDLDLILGVKPVGDLAYGGRHITIAAVTASSREAAAAAVKQCNSQLGGWTMKKAPGTCLGHMDAGASSCKDNKTWDLSKDGYPSTPTIAIASKPLDAYADCLSHISVGGVTIKLKGPKHSTDKTVWHSALYGSNMARAQAELAGFVSSKAKWTPYLNGHTGSNPDCPTSFSPRGKPGPANNRCWHWTAVA